MSSPMPYSPPAAAAADTAVLNQEMGVVLSGLEEFKTELLRLHNLVSSPLKPEVVSLGRSK